MAANETVTTSTGDLQLLIVDAESVDIPCADADVTSVDMASEVITVLYSCSSQSLSVVLKSCRLFIRSLCFNK